MQPAQCVLLFLVLAGNSALLRFLRSYTLALLLQSPILMRSWRIESSGFSAMYMFMTCWPTFKTHQCLNINVTNLSHFVPCGQTQCKTRYYKAHCRITKLYCVYLIFELNTCCFSVLVLKSQLSCLPLRSVQCLLLLHIVFLLIV